MANAKVTFASKATAPTAARKPPIVKTNKFALIITYASMRCVADTRFVKRPSTIPAHKTLNATMAKAVATSMSMN